MIAMTGDTLDFRYVNRITKYGRKIFWREVVRIAQFTRHDGRSGPDILREASL
jgi:hypothetical protein